MWAYWIESEVAFRVGTLHGLPQYVFLCPAQAAVLAAIGVMGVLTYVAYAWERYRGPIVLWDDED